MNGNNKEPFDPLRLVVPDDFRIACELFGIVVPDFLQLLCNNFVFLFTLVESEVEAAVATNSLVHLQDQIDKKNKNTNPYPFVKKNRDAKPYLFTTVGIARDSRCSFDYRKQAIKPHVEAMHGIYILNFSMKPYVYYDEETKIDFPIDFVLQCAMRNHSAVELLNAYMQEVSLAEHYARVHLKKIRPNPMLAFYLFVQRGYGKLMPKEHIDSMRFKEFIIDLQEFETRFFIYNRLAERIERYRTRLAYHHQIMMSHI